MLILSSMETLLVECKLQSMVKLHIKANDACSNMVANILPADPPPLPSPTPGIESKGPNFRTWSCCISIMLHIKLNGIANATSCKHIFCLYTHHRPLGRSRMSTFFLKVVVLHNKVNGAQSTMQAHSVVTRT